ncbi:adenosine kinase [Pseudovibrio exalbescens]|uniref:Carbohydrate kinase n=1 Tax=Pseudovibrio exalbescens TaxID=197461 RepID=A0A1U7JID9_9HYPH|nr:adenosine kinase [Pseudovibrio exalbescens]OKL44458.1 carbohydrate kinase [Pseudovibrio exalbescens]
MSELKYDALCIGNAITDVFSHVEDNFLVEQDLHKGAMRLIDTKEALRLYELMGQTVRISGGSAGNTAAGIASLGGKPAYIGKVSNDELGENYGHDMRGSGVHFGTEPLAGSDLASGRSMVLITPDGERTMNTYLGAATTLSPADIDKDVVEASAVTYMEGYLWDPEDAKKAFVEASRIAHQADRHVALSLSDSFCVDRFRTEFISLIKEQVVDLLFANEHELKALYETADLDTAIAAVRQDCRLTALTLGSEGAMVISREKTVQVPATPVERIADATGAGDLFASGFLFGLARGYDLSQCGELGCLCAGEVISHVGARPEQGLKALAEQSGFEL